MKVTIIGAGNVGGLTALQLCSLNFDEVVLIDIVPNLAYAKVLDISDARFIFKRNSRIQGTDDINRIAGSNILVITAGLPRKPGMTREELGQKNGRIIKGICQEIKRLCPEAVVIVVTNPLDAMTYLALKETDLPPSRILGMGLSLDTSRLANLITEELNVKVEEIEPCIIGSHGKGMLPLSRHTKVKGLPLEGQLDKEKINQLFERTVNRGAEIISQLGSGSAYFAPSAAIAELVKVIAGDEKRILPVSVYLNGEYELRDLCIGLPCRLGKKGIEEVIELELNEEEKAAFLKSAESVKQQISAISATSYTKSP